MGASQSGQPRTVSMENNTPVGVIDISDEVVQRLKNGIKAGTTKRTEETPPPTEEAKQSVPSSYPTPKAYPPGVIYVEPSITAVEVRRQKEAELAQNDLYWRKRLAQLEQTLNKTNAIMEKEYVAAVEDVRKRFHNAPPEHQLPPCQDLKAHLIACYRSNPGESLKCAEEVAAFTNCVSENRLRQLDDHERVDRLKPATAEKSVK